MLSAFGPAGAVAGAVAAIGGALWSAGDSARTSFNESRDAINATHKELQGILENGTMEEISRGMQKIAVSASEIRKAAPKQAGGGELLNDLLSLTGNGPSREERFAENQRQTMMVAGDMQALNQRALDVSARELAILEMRAAGRFREADALQKQLDLARQLSKIDAGPFSKPVKAQLKKDATANAAAEDRKKLMDAEADLKRMNQDLAFSQLETGEQINEVQQRMNDLLLEEDQLRANNQLDAMAVVDLERRRIGLQEQLNQLLSKFNQEAQQSAAHAKREADEAARANTQRKQAVMSAMDEYNLLKAKSTSRKNDDYQVEREIAIRQRREQLMKENGLTAAEATKIATEMRDMEEKINNGGRAPKIRGPKPRNGGKMGGLDEFQDMQGKPWGVNALPESEYDKMQRTPFPWEKDLIPGKKRGGLDARHAANAAEPGKGPNMDDYIKMILNLLPKGIADALLG